MSINYFILRNIVTKNLPDVSEIVEDGLPDVPVCGLSGTPAPTMRHIISRRRLFYQNQTHIKTDLLLRI